MIGRDYSPKEVMVISDYPLENEQRREAPYSEQSQITFKDALGKASFTVCRDLEQKYLLNSSTICFTYLSTERYTKSDFDWAKSIVSKRMIPEGYTYYQIPWLKDVWVSTDVWYELQNLLKQIQEVKPKLVIMASKWAFMLLVVNPEHPTTQLTTIARTKSKVDDKKFFGDLNKFRSSILTFNEVLQLPESIVIPIFTPAYLFLIKDKQFAVTRDYNKIARIYRKLCEGTEVKQLLASPRHPQLGLTNTECFEYLNNLLQVLYKEPTLVAIDVETRHGHIDCIGLAYDEYNSLTIPYSYMEEQINTESGKYGYIKDSKTGKETLIEIPIGAFTTIYKNYWNLQDELDIQTLLWEVMLHPNCKHVGQNYNYDCQYYYHTWKLSIFSHCDTMILHHVLHNTMQKDLAMLASLYCDDYVYWKSEIDIKDNHTRWKYNGKDCCYTLSIAKLLSKIMLAMPKSLQDFYQFQQFELVPVVVTTMNRGVKVDVQKKDLLNSQFTELMYDCLDKINYVFNEQINLNSTPQVKRAFKDLLGIKPVLNRKTKRESFGADAMLVYLDSYPEWRTLLTLFLEYKSIKVFVKTFLSAKVDNDGHMRCDYNPAGTKSYRLSSRKNVFGNGMNLANIPSKGKIDLRIALQELELEEKQITNGNEIVEQESELVSIEYTTDLGTTYEGTLELPNCKEIFLPSDDSWWFFDADYSAIDLHFVVWESDCKFLKDIIKAGKDVYSILASHYYQREIFKTDYERQIFKAVCHGSNYLGQAATLAAKAGLNIYTVNMVIKWYFNQCPEIPDLHKRIASNCRQFGYIENIFGARFECNDFNDPMWLNKMVAIGPQSSASRLVNEAWVALEKAEQGKNIQVLLQTHDSLSGQFKHEDKTAVQRIKQYMEIEIPYKDTLIIPANIKTSPISYGDCK